jgi:phytoene/squalene synthetase
LVDTAVWDLAGATFETRRELTAYCERWATAMIEPAAYGLSGGWRKLGTTLRELEMLSDLALEAHSGRLRMPLDELQNAGTEPQAVALHPWPSALASLVRDRHEALRAVLAKSIVDVRESEQPEARGLLVWAALAWQHSWRAQRALPNAIPTRRRDALGDAWRAWRSARRAMAGKFRLG